MEKQKGNDLTEAIKLFSVIIVIVILLRMKWDLGLVMVLSSILLGFLFDLSIYSIGYNIYLSIIDPDTLQLVGIVILTYVLSSLLRRTKSMEGIINSLLNFVADYRLILVFIASFLGLIPMPAGAMFSAPLLREIGDKKQVNYEDIMFSNYWFRHVWEFVWPLIPGVVLYASFIGVDVQKIFIIQFPLSFIALFVGFAWMYKCLENKHNYGINYQNWKIQIFTFLKSVWSILLVIFSVLFLKINLLLALIISIILLLLIQRISTSQLREAITKDVSIKVVVMIFGIMLFKQILENTNSVNHIPQFFSEIGINVWFILFFIPFLIGFLTGVTTAFIGIAFPILMPLIVRSDGLNMSMAMFAYLSGFTGMMISPMHLCFSVTIDYFGVNRIQFYKKLIFPLFVFFCLSVIYIFMFS